MSTDKFIVYFDSMGEVSPVAAWRHIVPASWSDVLALELFHTVQSLESISKIVEEIRQ